MNEPRPHADETCVHCAIGRFLTSQKKIDAFEVINHICQSIGEIIADSPPEDQQELSQWAFLHLGRQVLTEQHGNTLRLSITGLLRDAADCATQLADRAGTVDESSFRRLFADEAVRLAAHIDRAATRAEFVAAAGVLWDGVAAFKAAAAGAPSAERH